MKTLASTGCRVNRRASGGAGRRARGRGSRPGPDAPRMRLRPGKAILSASGLLLAALVAAGSAGCGHVTPPQRPPPLGPEEGPIYDAGAPPEDDEGDDGPEDDRR